MATHRLTAPAFPLTIALVAAAIAAMLVAAGDLGPRSAHMAAHIVIMNALAPLLAFIAAGTLRAPLDANRMLPLGFLLQICVFYAWHLPGAAMRGAMAHATMHVALLGAAILFWVAIFALEPAQRWRGFVALMVTGKLACLLGALLLFAPRMLDAGGADAALDDQRMAGMLMLAACPLCYLVSAIALAAQWLNDVAACADARLTAPR